jgi:hypothetical protein
MTLGSEGMKLGRELEILGSSFSPIFHHDRCWDAVEGRVYLYIIKYM